MAYVPTPHGGYRLIFSQGDNSIAFFQLLVNVGFAALLGAILATFTPEIVRGARKLPRWARQGIGIGVIALISIGAVAWRNFMEAAASRAQSDEEYADEQLIYRSSDAVKFSLRNAAPNWRLALRFDYRLGTRPLLTLARQFP